MTDAEVYLAAHAANLVTREREQTRQELTSVDVLGQAERDEQLARSMGWPIASAMCRLSGGRRPGEDIDEDVIWAVDAAMARQRLAAQREAGLDGALSRDAEELTEWIDAQLGAWAPDTFTPRIHAWVDQLLDARRRGSERGRMLRAQRSEPSEPRCGFCWALRHPVDHWARAARAQATDLTLSAILDALIGELGRTYDGLRSDHAVHGAAEVVTEVEVLAPIPASWNQPARTRVVSGLSGEASDAELALRQVIDPEAPFNGTQIALRAGERWLIHGERRDDGTVVALDGSRRLSA